MVSKVSSAGNDGPSRVGIQEQNANLVDRIQFG